MKNQKAIEDGHKARKRNSKGEYMLTPDSVCAMIARHVRAVFGDEVENKYSEIHASRGYFFVQISPPPRLSVKRTKGKPHHQIKDEFWRQALKEGLSLRRYSLGLLFRALRGEVLT